MSNEELRIRAGKIKVLFTDIDGTLTDGFTYYSKEGEELKRFNHRDGGGVHLLRLAGMKLGIITGENSGIVSARAAKLKADFCFIGVEDKVSRLKEAGIDFDEVAYIGDDFNDIGIMQHSAISFAVADASDITKKSAHIICSKNGGYGAFREAVEILLELKNIKLF